MAIDEPISAPKAPRFPPLPGSLAAAAAWPMHRLIEAHDGYIDKIGVTLQQARAVDEALVAPATTLADIEAKLRWAVNVLVAEPLAGMSALGPIGHPLDPEVAIEERGDRILWSALQDVIRLNREMAQ